MSEKDIQPITDPKQIPDDLGDEEQIAFWESHGVTEEYLAKTEEVPEEERPEKRSPRTKPVSIRFDTYTINRVKALAETKGVGYQTLIKAFVNERLYEEEQREGLLPSSITQESGESYDPVLDTVERIFSQRFREHQHDWHKLWAPVVPYYIDPLGPDSSIKLFRNILVHGYPIDEYAFQARKSVLHIAFTSESEEQHSGQIFRVDN
jgi:predicted DNA binding CopG/RHH family protein